MSRKYPMAPMSVRTRDHIIADQCLNYIERFIIDKGHTAERRRENHVYDLDIITFDEDGCEESGKILIRLKASDKLDKSKHEGHISFDTNTQICEFWINELMPVFLVLYDAQEKKAYWLYVQAYFSAEPLRSPKEGTQTVTLHVPLANEFTEDTVDYLRARKAAILAQLGRAADHVR